MFVRARLVEVNSCFQRNSWLQLSHCTEKSCSLWVFQGSGSYCKSCIDSSQIAKDYCDKSYCEKTSQLTIICLNCVEAVECCCIFISPRRCFRTDAALSPLCGLKRVFVRVRCSCVWSRDVSFFYSSYKYSSTLSLTIKDPTE